MIKYSNNVNKLDFVLKAEFKAKKQSKNLVSENFYITNFYNTKQAIIFLGNQKKWNKDLLKKAVASIVSGKINYQIYIKDFITKEISEKLVIRTFVEAYVLNFGDVFTLKTAKKPKPKTFTLIGLSSSGKKEFNIAQEESKVRNWVRSYQLMPPNELNSVNFANKIKKEFSKFKNIKIKILDKKEIIKNKMGLLLGVNAGSNFEPRLVVLEYCGNKTKQKTVIIGKGIMFDSGGYSLKPSNYIKTMKFDMSGAAIVAGAMKLIAKRKPKTNITVLMPLTDNLIGKTAQKVDSVQKSMSGKTIEINNTDAEGRLILADSITYAIKKLKATKVVTVATLTGAMSVALGNQYTGVWTTQDSDWEKLLTASKTKGERIWRMPFDKDFLTGFKKSKIADLYNTNYANPAGSNTAAMFLNEFAGKTDHIHFDIARNSRNKRTSYRSAS